MQKFNEKKNFLFFFQKDFSFHPQSGPKQKFQNSFQNVYKISKRQNNFIALSNEKNANIEESVFFNFPFDKGRLKTIVCWFFEKHGQYKTLKLLEKLKEVGFGSATNAGISLGIDDLKIPNQKITLLSTAETKVAKDLLHYRNAQITGIERIQRLIYTWNQTNDTLKQEVVRLFETTDLLNPIYMMAFSGARGNMSQVRQLVGMRGLMSDPQGQIIDFPIQSNFREGLTLTEYLISTYGARKGIVDTALRTATAGYLTRRLVDVAQHTIVSKFDCGTMRGIFLFDMKDGKKTIYSFQNRLIGRVLAQNIEGFEKNQKGLAPVPQSGTAEQSPTARMDKKQIAFRNQEIDSKLAQVISKVTKKAFVRSPLTCETSRFVCQLCYGWSFSHGKLVSVGEAVGIIAAQSIGEPGTQLTMRTFHTGGVFAGGLTDQILAPFDGKIKYFQNIPGTCVRTALSEIAFFTKMPGSFIVEKASQFVQQTSLHNQKKGKKSGEILRIPAYALLFCRNNEFVRKKQVLAQFSTVLKKMQYGMAEQTLYSTLSGEFVFGKSFGRALPDQGGKDLPKQIKEKNLQNTDESSKSVFSSMNQQKLEVQNPGLKIFENVNKIGEQSLLLEKRRTGDFSEVELKNDILWKSQNWTTVWILSGNIFCDSFNTNFHFREGDFFKKTSVIKRILWKKKKRYKYLFFEKKHIQKKIQKNIDYLFALEKNKTYTFYSGRGLFSQKKSLKMGLNFCDSFFLSPTLGHTTNPRGSRAEPYSPAGEQSKKHFFQTKTLQTNFSISNFNIFNKKGFLKAKKIFLYSTSFFSRETKTISFDIEKSNDLVFVQNKAHRFFTDFEKITLSFHPWQNEKKGSSLKKEQEKVHSHLFFRFLNASTRNQAMLFLGPPSRATPNPPTFSLQGARSGLETGSLHSPSLGQRKFFHYPLFLNISTFLKTFHISQKFRFFSSIYELSEIQFVTNSPSFVSDFKNQSLNKLKMSLLGKKAEQNQKNPTVLKNIFSNKKSFKTSFTAKKFSKNQKLFQFLKKNFLHSVGPKNNQRDETELKNIILKKFLLRLPIDKVSYQKFGYFSTFSTFVKTKKTKNSFQTFSTLAQKNSFFNRQRNIGKQERFVSSLSKAGVSSVLHPLLGEGDGNENFFGKDVPNYFSYSFFENSATKTAGIFNMSFFKNQSKKQKVYHFLCDDFFGQTEKKIFSLKPDFIEKTIHTIMKRSLKFIYLVNLFNFSDFICQKENTKQPKKIFFSSQSGKISIFELPTFSFLLFATQFFGKPFFVSFKKIVPAKDRFPYKEQQFFHSTKNNEIKFFYTTSIYPFKSLNKNKSFLVEKIVTPAPQFSVPLENGNGSKGTGKGFSFVVQPEKALDKKILDNTSICYWNELDYFPIVVPFSSSNKEKRNEGKKNQKIKFFVKKIGESKKSIEQNQILFINIQENLNKTDEKKKSFFFYNFGFNQIEQFQSDLNFFKTSLYTDMAEGNKENMFAQIQNGGVTDFYTKEIFWLPQENFMVFTSKILKEKFAILSTSKFFSSFDKNPFFFFVNRQGKKKFFSFDFEGFVKISKSSLFQSQNLTAQKNKKIKVFFPLHQKLSFYMPKNRLFRKKSKIFSRGGKNDFQKTLLSKFQKRMGNKKFENIQKLFSKKSEFLPEYFHKYSGKRFVFFQKFENQCFTCVPFKKRGQEKKFNFKKKIQKKSLSFHPLSGPKNSNRKISTFGVKTNKLQFKVEQGWPVFSFSSYLQNSFFKAHKKTIKKGQFFEKDLIFEQNNTMFETILLTPEEQNSLFSFPRKVNTSLETVSFQPTFFQKSKKCRYISLNPPFQFQSKETSELFTLPSLSQSLSHVGVDSIQGEKTAEVFSEENSFPPFFNIFSHSLSFSQKTRRKKINFVQFFRPFQYKILENPQNSKKFFQNIHLQYFSQIFSSSCFKLYKKYHSSLLNFQNKGKNFLEKNQNLDFEVLSNFQQIYFSQNISPFISFEQQTEQKNFKNEFIQKQKFPEEKKERLKKATEFQNFFKKQNLCSQSQSVERSSIVGAPFSGLSKAQLVGRAEPSIPAGEKGGSPSAKHSPLAGQSPSPLGSAKHNPLVGRAETKSPRKGQIELASANGFNPPHRFLFGEELPSGEGNGKKAKNLFFNFQKNKEKTHNFSFYPIQFLPLVLSFSKNSFLSFLTFSSFPIFSINAFKNTIEFCSCEKKGTFFNERFSLPSNDRNLFDFVETSSFWLNKDGMNFLFSPFSGSKKSTKISMNFNQTVSRLTKQKSHSKETINFLQNSIFQKSLKFYGSTSFLSPYQGELLSIFTHDMYWWKKASEISTLQKFDNLFTIITKKDLFSIPFPSPLGKETQTSKEMNFVSQNTSPVSLPFEERNFSNLLKGKQKDLRKLYDMLSNIYQRSHLNHRKGDFSSNLVSPIDEKIKISSFQTKYENKIYTFQNLNVGYPSPFKKPFLGSFVVYGDNFFGSAIQKPGQIIHLSFSSMTLRRGQPCLVSSNGILHFSNIPYIKKNVPLVTLPYQTVQAGDIVQGIPKVEQFFEARTSLQGRLFVSSLPILLKGIFERYKVLLPLEQATRQSFLKIQQIIVDGVQRVYRSQGVSITDKHLEVVVRQMTTKVQILHGAQTGFFPGELVNVDLVERVNKFLMVKIRYEPVILGITRASLEVDSFLSASSFQQTTKILSLAAISRKKDFLKGLKENLLVGNLIPSGTGYFTLSKKI